MHRTGGYGEGLAYAPEKERRAKQKRTLPTSVAGKIDFFLNTKKINIYIFRQLCIFLFIKYTI